jgi:hypothetical protein
MENMWKEWGNHQKHYPYKATWWTRYVKPMIKRYFQRKGAGCRRERRTLENFYYEALHDALEKPMESKRKATILKRIKEQIINLHYKEGQKLAANLEENELMEGEEISLHTYIRARKKQTQYTISQIQGTDGEIYKKTRDIMRIGTTYIRQKYRVIEVDNENVMEITDNMQVKMNREAKELMDAPITMEDIEKAVKIGKSNKAQALME